MRIVFLGTADFAVPCLKALWEGGHELAGVVTQPDRPKGRGKKLAPPPVKEIAQAMELTVLQPERIKEPEAIEQIRRLNPECLVVVAYGQLLPKSLLEMAPYGCINVHASLLPRYRGAAPIHRAIMDGCRETGVTTMYVTERLDAGDIILQSRRVIEPDMTVGELHDLLAADGAKLLLETLALMARGEAVRKPQVEAEATYAAILTREDELINWESTAQEIVNQIRGMDPWPGAYTRWQGKNLKIWKATLTPGNWEAVPGTVVSVDDRGLLAVSGDGQGVLIRELQLPGKKRLAVSDFLRGNSLMPGTILGRD